MQNNQQEDYQCVATKDCLHWRGAENYEETNSYSIPMRYASVPTYIYNGSSTMKKL